MPSYSAMRYVSRTRYGGQSGFTVSKNPGIRTAIGRTTQTRTSTSYSAAKRTSRGVARYEYGDRKDQKTSTVSGAAPLLGVAVVTRLPIRAPAESRGCGGAAAARGRRESRPHAPRT